MFMTRPKSSNSKRCGTSASRRRGPISASSLIIVKTRSITARNSFAELKGLAMSARRDGPRGERSIDLVLLVRFPVHHGSRSLLLLLSRVVHDARRRLLVPMGGVLDQFLLAELEALRLASAGLLDREALFAPALGEFEQPVG